MATTKTPRTPGTASRAKKTPEPPTAETPSPAVKPTTKKPPVKKPVKKPTKKPTKKPIGVKNPGGRPPKHSDPVLFDMLVTEYFDQCGPIFAMNKATGEPFLDPKGNPIIIGHKHEHLDGLCVHLGISYETWCEYRRTGKFSDTVARADQRSTSYAINRLYDKDVKPQGITFALQNRHSFKNEKEITTKGTLSHEHKGEVKSVVEFRIVKAPPQETIPEEATGEPEPQDS